MGKSRRLPAQDVAQRLVTKLGSKDAKEVVAKQVESLQQQIDRLDTDLTFWRRVLEWLH